MQACARWRQYWNRSGARSSDSLAELWVMEAEGKGSEFISTVCVHCVVVSVVLVVVACPTYRSIYAAAWKRPGRCEVVPCVGLAWHGYALCFRRV